MTVGLRYQYRDLEPGDIVNAVVLYFYNVDPGKQLEALFSGANEAYLENWLVTYHAGFTEFWGRLDSEKKDQYVEAALTKYADEVRKNRKEIERHT